MWKRYQINSPCDLSTDIGWSGANFNNYLTDLTNYRPDAWKSSEVFQSIMLSNPKTANNQAKHCHHNTMVTYDMWTADIFTKLAAKMLNGNFNSYQLICWSWKGDMVLKGSVPLKPPLPLTELFKPLVLFEVCFKRNKKNKFKGVQRINNFIVFGRKTASKNLELGGQRDHNSSCLKHLQIPLTSLPTGQCS